MNKSILALSIGVLAAPGVFAMDQTYDTRSMAMGGTGAATANTRNAAFLNPSMLTTKDDDAFAWEFPIVSVRVLDEKNLQADADALSTSGDNLSTALQNFQAAYAGGNQADIQAKAGAADAALISFNTSLNAVNGKALNAGAFAGTMLGIPSKSFSFALVVDARAELGGRFNYAAADAVTVGTLSSNLAQCGGGNTAACANAYGTVGAGGTVNGLQSTLEVRGVVASEVGVGMAHHFDGWGGIDVGITPKFTKLRIFDEVSQAQQSGGVSTSSNNESNASMFNMDLGLSRAISNSEDSELRAGLMVKDMLARNFKTVLGNDIAIKPRAAVGLGYLTPLTTTGIDLDLLPNKPMVSGFGSDSQFVRVGAEFDAWKWAQLRVGYRHDLKGNYKGLASAGLGLSLLGLHIDLSYAAAGNTEKSAAIQTGLHF